MRERSVSPRFPTHLTLVSHAWGKANRGGGGGRARIGAYYAPHVARRGVTCASRSIRLRPFQVSVPVSRSRGTDSRAAVGFLCVFSWLCLYLFLHPVPRQHAARPVSTSVRQMWVNGARIGVCVLISFSSVRNILPSSLFSLLLIRSFYINSVINNGVCVCVC